MKRVIRKGVFETNSSSTHSLSLVKNASRNDKVEENISFEIRSNLAKTVFLLGLIDNAEYEFRYKWQYLDDNPNCKEEKEKAIKILKDTDWLQEYYEKIVTKCGDLKKLTFRELVEVVDASSPGAECVFGKISDYLLEEPVKDYIWYRKCALKFKDVLIKAFGELEGLTNDEAMDKLYYEEYKSVMVEKILLESEDKEKDLKEYAKDICGYEFNEGYKKSDLDIVEYAKKYLIDDVKKEIKLHDGRFFCSRYFKEGCLADCYCGFQDFKNICWKLDLNFLWKDEEYYKFAKEFLTDKYKFQAIEKYCGCYFEGNGEIY